MSSENNREEDVSRATDNSLNLPESHLDRGTLYKQEHT